MDVILDGDLTMSPHLSRVRGRVALLSRPKFSPSRHGGTVEKHSGGHRVENRTAM